MKPNPGGGGGIFFKPMLVFPPSFFLGGGKQESPKGFIPKPWAIHTSKSSNRGTGCHTLGEMSFGP